MKKSHSLWTDSGGNPAGEPVDEPDRSFKTKVGITAHQVPSVYHPARPGPFPPAQGTSAGAWNSGTCDAGRTGSGASTAGNPDSPFPAAEPRPAAAPRVPAAPIVAAGRRRRAHDDQSLGIDQPPGSGPLIQDPEQVRGRDRPDHLAPMEESAVVPRLNLVPH